MSKNEFQLDVIPGDFGLPSLDHECLTVMAYCAMNKIPGIRINYRHDLYISRLPALRTDSGTFYGADDIISYLEDRRILSNSSFDSGDITKRQFNIRSYRTFMERLDNCLQYLHWYDEENYKENTGVWYAKICSFPMNFFVPRMLRNRAVLKVEKLFTQKVLEHDFRERMIEKRILTETTGCLNELSKHLTNQPFLLGQRPSPADAYLFSYLALLSKPPVRKAIIQSHIQITGNLQRFVDQTLQLYFADSLKSFQEAQAEANSNTSVRWSDVLFCGTVATLAMVYYAFANGMIMTAIDDDDDDGDDDGKFESRHDDDDDDDQEDDNEE